MDAEVRAAELAQPVRVVSAAVNDLADEDRDVMTWHRARWLEMRPGATLRRSTT
jgi:hypothetical protein